MSAPKVRIKSFSELQADGWRCARNGSMFLGESKHEGPSLGWFERVYLSGKTAIVKNVDLEATHPRVQVVFGSRVSWVPMQALAVHKNWREMAGQTESKKFGGYHFTFFKLLNKFEIGCEDDWSNKELLNACSWILERMGYKVVKRVKL